MSSLPLSRTLAARDELGDGIRRHHPSGQVPPCGGAAFEQELLTAAGQAGLVRARRIALPRYEQEARDLERFLASGRHGVMSYLGDRNREGRLLREVPTDLMPGARSALIVALPYPSPVARELSWPRVSRSGRAVGRVAAYAGGRDYHQVLKERLLLLADQIADLLGHAVEARACVDSAPLFERQLARDAGWAFLGKNTLAIAPQVGSYFNLGVLLLALPPPVEDEPSVPEGCGSCSACVDRCPTGALDGRSGIDATRCISYLTIEYRGIVARELRPLMGDWVFGCDLCQAACPYNASKGVPAGEVELTQSPFWREPELLSLLSLSSNGYKRSVKGTALRRVDRSQLVRNAAIALGNAREASARGALFDVARHHASLAARVHATWALGRLLGLGVDETVREYLQELSRDDAAEVQEEAKLSLLDGGLC